MNNSNEAWNLLYSQAAGDWSLFTDINDAHDECVMTILM